MAKKANSRNAQGAGTIRKKTVTRNGKPYTYWEARYTEGRDPGTGKQVQKSIYGKTQKEVREKLQAVSVSLTTGTYTAPNKITVGEWATIWLKEYNVKVKETTLDAYAKTIDTHIRPAMGNVELTRLNTETIQKFYNGLLEHGQTVPQRDKDGKIIKKNGKPVMETAPMSAKSVRNIHGVLHKMLAKAVALKKIPFNPADNSLVELPRATRKEIAPLDAEQIGEFVRRIQGTKYEDVFMVALFTGMRQSEVLGLTWDCIDFKAGTIKVAKQLTRRTENNEAYHFTMPKSNKGRIIKPAAAVMEILKRRRVKQAQQRLLAGEAWESENPPGVTNLVFSNELGGNLSQNTIRTNFKEIASSMGIPETRFHDLRHSYAVTSLQNGDDIKTVQGNLGHATAAFTLDVYGHVTDQMRQDSADRMQAFISDLKKA